MLAASLWASAAGVVLVVLAVLVAHDRHPLAATERMLDHERGFAEYRVDAAVERAARRFWPTRMVKSLNLLSAQQIGAVDHVRTVARAA